MNKAMKIITFAAVSLVVAGVAVGLIISEVSNKEGSDPAISNTTEDESSSSGTAKEEASSSESAGSLSEEDILNKINNPDIPVEEDPFAEE